MQIKSLVWSLLIGFYGIAMLGCIPTLWQTDLYLNIQVMGTLALLADGVGVLFVAYLVFQNFLRG